MHVFANFVMSWKRATCLRSVTPSDQGKFLPWEKNKDFYSGNTMLWSDENKIKHLANMQHAMFWKKTNAAHCSTHITFPE